MTYDNHFVDASSLPPAFFTPQAIGYVNVEDAFDDPALHVPAYWLGRTFTPDDGRPPLVLTFADVVSGPGQGAGWQAVLSYVQDPAGPGVTLSLWRPDDWAAILETEFGRLLWTAPCVETREPSAFGRKKLTLPRNDLIAS